MPFAKIHLQADSAARATPCAGHRGHTRASCKGEIEVLLVRTGCLRGNGIICQSYDGGQELTVSAHHAHRNDISSTRIKEKGYVDPGRGCSRSGAFLKDIWQCRSKVNEREREAEQLRGRRQGVHTRGGGHRRRIKLKEHASISPSHPYCCSHCALTVKMYC